MYLVGSVLMEAKHDGIVNEIVGARESLNRRENMARRKVKNGQKRAIFCRPFRLSLAPTICLWVSEDVIGQLFIYYFYPWLNGEKSQSSKPYAPLSTFFLWVAPSKMFCNW